MNLTQISGSIVLVSSLAALLLFAMPSIIGAIKQSGPLRAIALFFTLGILILAYEFIAVKTKLPYGAFTYGSVFSPQLFSTVPVVVALTYPPLIIGAFWLAKKISIGFLVPLFTAVFTTLTYTVLAPAMLKLTLWQWETPGRYYGVHLRAFIGWFVCALIAGIIINAIWGENEPRRLSAYSWFAILLFWGGVNLGVSNIAPGIAGIAGGFTLLSLFIIEKRRDK